MMKPTDLLYLGLGAATMAKERLEGVFKELEKQGQISREEMEKFLDEVKAKGASERESMEKMIRDKVHEAVAEMGLATKKDIAELKALLKKKS
ncbi:hypothetical protein dsat_1993 [Alkalidesulfovibrio alkalitolerans DSM 16529]|uniref:Polyhydroxyalkanoate synthesis regulator phasin n=1 Tax=Alkalidesulfovibrio alkalitolerans DSM 16529 TaxID=1121439 RepID=S7TEN8_9BACT|nr:phasin family protein [Alkalidesulfovibrio alkalitolerans]EPR35652.1 hypothetical protein dsat_1993 [Alkalidesulfovibrio alkalitolerans DSM 16529]